MIGAYEDCNGEHVASGQFIFGVILVARTNLRPLSTPVWS